LYNDYLKHVLEKFLRKLLRSIVDGEQFQIPSTIDDEAIIDEIQEVLHARIGQIIKKSLKYFL
jgi:hypothetical protein